nr:hypothetical protein GCM10010200_068290 [Actinomadura rugatobispora]
MRAITGNASASSCDGTATRTIWHPDAVNSAICCNVAFTSAVSVVVIDCTDTGASPPTGTSPTMIRRDARRAATGRDSPAPPASSRIAGIPSETLIPLPLTDDPVTDGAHASVFPRGRGRRPASPRAPGPSYPKRPGRMG